RQRTVGDHGEGGQILRQRRHGGGLVGAAGGQRQQRGQQQDSQGAHVAIRQQRLQDASPRPTPSLRITIAAGQKPVNADWNRLAPTNTVSQKKAGWTNWVSATLTSTITPAKACTARSRVIAFLLGSRESAGTLHV